MSKRKVFTQSLLLALVASGGYLLQRIGFFQAMLDLIDQTGPAAPLVFLGVYILTCVFFFPSFIFTFASGVLFGILPGVILSVLGLGIGSTLALLIGRYLARPWVTQAFSDNLQFQALDEAVRTKGWKIVLLARLSPIFPFLVGNYAFGTSKISAAHYFLASVLGSIPSILVYVYMGTAAGNMANLDVIFRERTTVEWVLFISGFIATIGLMFYLKRFARKALES